MSSATPTPLPRERKTNTWSSRCVTWTTSQMHTVTASSGEKLCKNGSRVIAKKEYLCISLSRGLFVFYWLWCCCIKWLVFTDHHKNYLRIIGVFMRIQVPATVAKFKSNGNVPFSLPPPSICPPPQKKKKTRHMHMRVSQLCGRFITSAMLSSMMLQMEHTLLDCSHCTMANWLGCHDPLNSALTRMLSVLLVMPVPSMSVQDLVSINSKIVRYEVLHGCCPSHPSKLLPAFTCETVSRLHIES